jgi:DnaA-homolog protein
MSSRQLPLGIRLRDSSVFSSYFPGRNRTVVDVLQSLGGTDTRGVGAPPTCLWLHGTGSVGKTHLLQALCARDDVGIGTVYVPLREVAILGSDLLSGYGKFAVVCLDDAEAIAGHGDWERAVFSLHQELHEGGGHLVVSGPAPPSTRGFRLPDLASRLGGGLVLMLQPLDEEGQMHALQLRAQLRGFELPDETAQFLVRRLPRDMASLCAFLDELDEASLIEQRRLTVPFVRAVLERR